MHAALARSVAAAAAEHTCVVPVGARRAVRNWHPKSLVVHVECDAVGHREGRGPVAGPRLGIPARDSHLAHAAVHTARDLHVAAHRREGRLARL